MTAVLRLLALVALLLMPFGMAAAPAESAVQHHPAAAMAIDHCPDQQSGDDRKGAVGDCAMPCSAALPAVELAPADSPPGRSAPMQLAVEPVLTGLVLEIATPPPKLS